MYVYLGSLLTSLTELASGRPPGGTAERVFYFAGLAVTIAVTLVVTRVARRALAEATESQPAAGAHAAAPALIRPDDAHNRRLVAQVHPARWTNPTPSGRYNLVVVGGGTAGLVSATGAAGLGAKVALVERHLLGGDCLNVGCVPSKSLIAAARAAAAARRAGELGVHVDGVSVYFPAVMERMRRLRADVAPTDGAPRLKSLGVDVYLGDGRFTGPRTVEVDGLRLEFARAVVATGARAAAPPIAGLADAGYLTNETIFELTELPRRLVVIGAGPIGCEMAQSFAAFGSQVTVIDAGAHVLPREDADAAEIVARHLRNDGVRLVHDATITRVERRGRETTVHYTVGGQAATAACDAVLVGVGRAPNVEDLGLESAGIRYDRRGVTVDDHLRTTNPRVYAAGDVAGRHQFTHTADAHARIVLRNALFLGRRRLSALHVPWCTYTTPELAHVGLSAAEAGERGIDVETLTIPLHDVDRARLDGEDDGFLRVHARKRKGTIVGATLVATHAGEMISEVTLAIAAGVSLGTIANVIHPYPTQAEALKKAGDAWNRTRLTPRVKTAFERWMRLRR
jgi:pyruvate/2-oxoglutarate dehydrogenase complex dihydrolipoamide dehydrogenase (E3) component